MSGTIFAPNDAHTAIVNEDCSSRIAFRSVSNGLGWNRPQGWPACIRGIVGSGGLPLTDPTGEAERLLRLTTHKRHKKAGSDL